MAGTRREQKLGKALLELRESSGWTQDNVAAEIHVARNTLWRIETGRFHATKSTFRRNFEKLLDLYKADEEQRAELVALYETACSPSWWADERYADLYSSELKLYYSLEADAKTIERVNLTGIYGLFQIPDYARAVNIARVMSDQVAEREIELRLLRQQEAFESRRKLSLTAVVDEAALRRVVGSRAIMAKQLDHLLALLDRGLDLTVRVLPFTPGAVIQSDTDSTIFGMGDGEVHASIDTGFGVLNYDDSAKVSQLSRRFEAISQAALDQQKSGDLIREIADEHRKNTGR